MMRVEIDPPVAHVAPLSRSLLSTAALDIVGLATAREAGPGSATSSPPTPVSVHGDTARRTLPPVSHEDLWATPTSDLADLVAQVLAQLTGVRRSS